MKTLNAIFLAAAVTLLAGCDDSSKKTEQAVNAVSNIVDAPLNYVGAVMQAQKYSEKQIDLAYVNEAIQQFNAAEGHYPKDLQEMIPNYLGKMPQAPYGSKIVYDANTGTITVVKQ
jgi:type II secretory pathway pseudopilin PulG